MRSGRGPSLLDVEWPEPLVPMSVIAERAPWLKPDDMLMAYAPPRLIDVASLVTSQENSCRFCYGATRAGMRIAGYSDEQIADLEREVELADELTREVVIVARKLARSNPRPVRAELAGLAERGLNGNVIAEIVFAIASTCYANRVSTFLALPPQRAFERMAETWTGRLIGSIVARGAGGLARRVRPTEPVAATGFFAPLILQLPDAPLAGWFARLVDQAFRSGGLNRRTKLLMLAVIARTMECRFCEEAARCDLEGEGLSRDGFDRIIGTLSSPELGPQDGRLLDWARETVNYETGKIQKLTRSLAGEVGVEVLLEAVGTAAVSNTAVRLAMLLE